MSKKRSRNLYIPIFAIIATALTLMALLAVVSYRNIARERERTSESLSREGLTIIKALEAATRTGMMAMAWQSNQLQTLVDESVKEHDIAYLYLYGAKGEVIAGHEVGARGEKQLSEADLKELESAKATFTRRWSTTEGKRIFEIKKALRGIDMPGRGRQMQMMHGMGAGPMGYGKLYVSLGLDMGPHERAQKEYAIYSIIMAAILFFIGTASLYFILILHNYYFTKRTLARIKTYADNVVESMANGLISVDSKGNVVTANREAAQMLEIKEEQLAGLPISAIFGQNYGDLALSALEGKKVVEREVDIVSLKGKLIPVSVSLNQLKDEGGENLGAVIILRDLREVKTLQEKVRRSERLASLGRLAAGVAHEIRNPLSSIKGFAQYFQAKFSSGSEDQNYAKIMIKEVDRLNRVIADILDYAGPSEPRLNPSSIREIIEHSIKLIWADAERKKIQIIKGINDLPDSAMVDKDQLTQALLNVMLNAIEAMGEGGTMRVEAFSSEDRMITIKISDNGKGISKEDLSKVFDPFFTNKKRGTGLGLAIVYNIITNHKGEINIDSEEGSGTTVTMRFPAKLL